MKVVISGGHITPALAVIEAFHRLYPKTELIFIGREYAQEKEQIKAKERSEVERRGVPFFAIKAAKVHRTYFWRNLGEVIKFFPSLNRVYRIFKQEKPDVFLSFGGYLAVPIALVSKLMHVPVITHEQTRAAGLANTLIAQMADLVAVSYERTRDSFPKKKVVVTGNPLRPAFRRTDHKKPAWLQVPTGMPLIYVTGGSQGSHVLNQNLSRIVSELVTKAVVVHQCGSSNDSTYLHEMETARATLPKAEQKRYIVREWIAEEHVAWLFQHATVVVARSGANTVLEVAASSTPAIFIPLPFAHDNEQLKNAQWLATAGSAAILQQKDLTAQSLSASIFAALEKQAEMKKHAEAVSKEVILNSDERLAELCVKLYEQATQPIS
ncbi:MAG TPA: UDP-N-acetylglucosamine--N-acetylmuramyl-(pentapeptide) pyrophosphoryl-undecaprenol N-acetylglucosamine transferase [Candidatus Saccharimonadia bacterium]|nr:UDP-N-acetylglucosamine--N-acetylmuramyl-(pentapeptide) pyrophosphoryl-undecaprenol N-acetylglucosamine transferase [Candidatus Saccharimonadia bacterium]